MFTEPGTFELEWSRLIRQTERALADRQKETPATQYSVAVIRVLCEAGRGSLAESLGLEYVAYIERCRKVGMAPAVCAARIIKSET